MLASSPAFRSPPKARRSSPAGCFLERMADPHSVPLPASRGSLDGGPSASPFEPHHHHHSTLPDVDEADTSADAAAWFDDGAQEHKEPAEPPAEADEGQTPSPPEDGADQEGGVEQEEPAQGDGEGGAEGDERIQLLEDELDRTRQDRDAWEAQYQSLLAKLTAMRNTLGDKLKQDAVRLCPR